MQKWEYAEKYMDNTDSLLSTLEEYGELGWELCGVNSRNDNKSVLLYFKRPKGYALVPSADTDG
jgi:hypothetical protein